MTSMFFFFFLTNYIFSLILSYTNSGFLHFSMFRFLHYEKFKLCLQNTLNTLKTTRVYFGVLHETVESVNPLDQSAFSPFDSTTNEYASTEALVKISQDMARVLDRLTTPRALSDSIRKHGVEEFMVQVWKSPIKTSFGLKNWKGL